MFVAFATAAIRGRHVRRLSMTAPVLALLSTALGQGIEFPSGANVLNVQTFGAVPNDNNDDLPAFQAALNATVGTGRILYVPDGVYNFDGRLNWGGIGSGGFFTLQGQSRAGVILKLKDGADGFDNPASPRVFIDAYEGNTANQFRNYLRDVTIDVGANNPGAIGLEFQANNTGRIENITIRSSDPLKRGRIGLNQNFAFPGPLLIRNVTIDGFDEGYVGAPQEYNAVFENLTLLNQRQVGLAVWRLPLQIRNLVSQNSVPVIRSLNNPGAWGHVVVDGGTFTGLSGASSVDAVIAEPSSGLLVLRNVNVSGYRNAIADSSLIGGASTTVPNGLITQYATDPSAALNPSPTTILPLPVEETPAPPPIPISQWVSVKAFGAVENDNLDDTAAIRAAMASGSPVVYFPSGVYIVSETITVGPSVRRVEGLMSDLFLNAPLTTENRPVFRVPPGSQAEVHFSGVNTSFQSPAQTGGGVLIEQATANTLVIRDGDLTYRNSVPGGRLFLENIVGTNMTFTGQRVWARQLNPEGSTFTHVTNDGGDLYVLGLKTEGASTAIDSRNRARTVILGGLIYPATAILDRTRPMIINNESSISFSLPESGYVDFNNVHVVWVRETRDGVTTDFTRSMLPGGRGHSDLGGQIALYNGYRVDPATPPAPAAPTLVSSSLESVTISWPAVTPGVSGIARYNVYRDGVFLRSSMTTTFTDAGRPDGAEGVYRVSAVSGAGLESVLSAGLAAATQDDEVGPRLIGVRSGLDARYVTLTFSEPLDATSAATPANYQISGPSPVTVLLASPSPDGRSVRLTLSGMTPGQQTLTFSNLTDRASTPNVIAAGTRASFEYSAASNGTGLTGRYFNTNIFTGSPLLTRIDPTVNFIYGLGSPDPSVPADNFAVRWSGKLRPRFDEAYTISIRSDDGSRVFLDGRLIVANWFDQAPTERGATVVLDSSREYDFVVEYYEAGFGASVELFWQSASQPRQIIPQSALFPDSILTTVRTWQGAGADIDLSRVTPGPGTGNSMGAFHSPAAGAFHQAAYWRFDLAALDLANNTVVDAVGTLTQTFFGVGDGKRLINVFAVNQAPGADSWIESGAGFVTWQTAPGNSDSGSQADATSARWMSTYLLDNSGFQNNFAPDRFFFDGDRLLEAIRADTDGRLSFLAKRLDASNEGQSWFTKEWGTPDMAPGLKVELIPRCPQVVQGPTVASASQGQNLTVLARIRGASAPTPLSYQWLRDGLPIADGAGGLSPGGGTAVGASGSVTLTGRDASVSLTILGARATDSGALTLAVSNSCGSATSSPTPLSVINTCPADLNGDTLVDDADFVEFAGAYNLLVCDDPAMAPGCPADFDANGFVDDSDFVVFAAAYNELLCP